MSAQPAVVTAATGGGLPAMIALGGASGARYNLLGYRVCGARNSRRLYCGRLGRCPFHGPQLREEPNGERLAMDSAVPVDVAVGEHERVRPEQLREWLAEGRARIVLSAAVTANALPGEVNQDGERWLEGTEAMTFLDAQPMENGESEAPTGGMRFKRAWTLQEHARFLEGMACFGRGKWKQVAQVVGTRNAVQCQSHAQKFFGRHAEPNAEATPPTPSQRRRSAAVVESPPTPPAAPSSSQRMHRKRSIHDYRDTAEARAEAARMEELERQRQEREASRHALRMARKRQRDCTLTMRSLQTETAKMATRDVVVPLDAEGVSELLRCLRRCCDRHLRQELRAEMERAEQVANEQQDDEDNQLVPVRFVIPEHLLPKQVKVHRLRRAVPMASSESVS
ncbi:hypothetical protein CDCA_CDCA03G0918 [Cyanidium caldarium]|uniref:Uncharacterized protein n=1 Tax=Cyanidium caldarium TaxID=2771 RepID=A0AAV9IS58_CYACA|nr:hypothetical protein CDCA_CDCA03G0918 [Cyanidium caldarium]